MKTILFNKRGMGKMELIIACVIVVVLIGLSVPKFLDIYTKTKEGSTKYNLNRVRSAIAAYYGDHKGTYPTDDLDSLVPEYIESIPYVHVTGAAKSNKVYTGEPNGKGGWFYYNHPESPEFGTVLVNIDGVDLSGRPWTEN